MLLKYFLSKRRDRRKWFINTLLIAISLISLGANLSPQTWGGKYVRQAATQTIRINGNITLEAGSARLGVDFYYALYYVGRSSNQSKTALFLITFFKLTNLDTATAKLPSISPDDVQLMASSGKTYTPYSTPWPQTVAPGQTLKAEFDFTLPVDAQAKEIDWSYQGQTIVVDLTNTPIATTSATETGPPTTIVTSSTFSTTTSSVLSQTTSTNQTSAYSSNQLSTTSTRKTITSSTQRSATSSNASSETSQTGDVNIVPFWLIVGAILLTLFIIVIRRRKRTRERKTSSLHHVAGRDDKPYAPPPTSVGQTRPERKPKNLQEWVESVDREEP